MKRSITFLTLIVVLFMFAACGSKSSDQQLPAYDAKLGSKSSYTVTVKITGANGESYFDGKVVVKGTDSPTAAQASLAAFSFQGGIAYTEKDGMIDGIAGIKSTNEQGWLYYINGKMSDKGAHDQQIKDGDLIEWKYLSYSEAFGTGSSSLSESKAA